MDQYRCNKSIYFCTCTLLFCHTHGVLLLHFGIDRSMKTKVMILAAPIIAHGFFDSILFCMQINEAMSGLLVILFVVFFDKMRKRANIRINELVNK